MATPFVQGRLRSEAVTVTVQSECGHCKKPLHLRIDSDLRTELLTAGAAPRVFHPIVNWEEFREPNILDGF